MRIELELYRRRLENQSGNEVQVGLGWSPAWTRYYFYLFDHQGATWGASWALPREMRRTEGIPVVFRKANLAILANAWS